MEINYRDCFGNDLKLKPRVELYSVQDFLGRPMPGLAVVFDTVGENDGDIEEEYGVLTVSFGEMIGLKDCAFIDTNHFPDADQFLKQGIALDTGLTRRSGFCTYPLWQFNVAFLKECGGENYRKYSDAYNRYFGFDDGETSQDPTEQNACQITME
ncbi:MAG: DUF4313 domain-containing protein [Clostridiales bacterium]|nr:DUF4313 domain-containing protein [Clostridiales bacterium]